MNSITCPYCGKEVEVTEALKHQVEESVLAEVEKNHKQELLAVKQKTQEEAARKIKDQLDLELKDKQNALEETQQQKKELQNQLLEMTRTIRELKDKDEQRTLELERRLSEEREKLKEEAARRYQEEHRLKELELRKQLEDAMKVNEELRRKLTQGSQQMQGEVLELDLEMLLGETFRDDVIEPVGKGVTGADIKQMVRSPRGFMCGTILWETKRTKAWDDRWIAKLKDDLRSQKGYLAAIVSQILPEEAKKGIGLKDGVWVSSFELVIPLATLLRKCLLDVGFQKAVSAHRGEKADILYSYITGHEFQQQVEAMLEVFQEMEGQVARERLVFEKQWKQRQAQIKRLLVSTTSIVGTMQGLLGSSSLQIQGLETPELASGE
ncbi:DUF2130 domain-containing protein [Candidatus Woesebacteria bacterium]|nr:DUF2130 domain-containing protein [Candidatus Woesebacteria bacterium]